jgi:hypothetical protein
MALRALLVEDNRVIRENLIPTLEALSQARIEGVAETEAEAIAWLNSHEGWGRRSGRPFPAGRFRLERDRLVQRAEGQPAGRHLFELRNGRGPSPRARTGCRRCVRQVDRGRRSAGFSRKPSPSSLEARRALCGKCRTAFGRDAGHNRASGVRVAIDCFDHLGLNQTRGFQHTLLTSVKSSTGSGNSVDLAIHRHWSRFLFFRCALLRPVQQRREQGLQQVCVFPACRHPVATGERLSPVIRPRPEKRTVCNPAMRSGLFAKLAVRRDLRSHPTILPDRASGGMRIPPLSERRKNGMLVFPEGATHGRPSFNRFAVSRLRLGLYSGAVVHRNGEFEHCALQHAFEGRLSREAAVRVSRRTRRRSCPERKWSRGTSSKRIAS